MARQFHKEEYHNVPLIYRDYIAVSTEEYVEAFDKAMAKLEEASHIMFKSL
jgi:hypothetical protein